MPRIALPTLLVLAASLTSAQAAPHQTDFVRSGFCARYQCKQISKSPYGSAYTGYNHTIYQYAAAGVKRLTVIVDKQNAIAKADMELSAPTLEDLELKKGLITDYFNFFSQADSNGNYGDCLSAITKLRAAQFRRGTGQAILTRSRNCTVGYDVQTRRYLLMVTVSA